MRKIKSKLPILTGLLITFIIVAGCSTQGETNSTPKYTISGISKLLSTVPAVSFELSSPLPNFPDKLQVYKMVYPELNEEYVRNLGVKFGLTGEVREDSSGFSMQDKAIGAYLAIRKPTGTIRYDLFSYFEIPSADLLKSPPVLPSDAEALKIATDFLTERGLLPQGDVAYKVDVGDSSGDIATTLLVSFQHAVQITGPGARHGLRIGGGGKVVEVFINPTNPLDLPPLEMVAVKSAEQAYREMKTDNSYYAPSESRRVKIDSVTVAYWLEAIGEGQEYVAPVYMFKGQCLDETGKVLEEPFVSIMEAVK
jgi:hypothetical protein